MSPEAVSHLSNVWFKVTDLQVASGRGCRVTTTDGEEYLDFAAGIAVNSTGHSHPHVVEAIADPGRPVHPRPGQRVHPRPARAAGRPPRRRDARRHRHVLLRQLRRRDHRGGDQARQAGHRPAERDRVRRLVPRPHPPDDGDDDVEDDLPGRPRPAAVGHLRRAVPRPAGRRPGRRGGPGAARARPPAGHDDRAGGDGGDDPRARARRGRLRPGAAAFLAGIVERCRALGILFVADEVQSGFGRTGEMFAVEHHGIEPDVICMAKGIASGFPFAALGTRASSTTAGRRGATAAPTAATRSGAPPPWPRSTSSPRPGSWTTSGPVASSSSPACASCRPRTPASARSAGSA